LSSNAALEAEMKEDMLDVEDVTCTSAQAVEDPPATYKYLSICNLDILARPEHGEISPGVDFAANSLEQQATRFEQYARPTLERLNVIPVPASALKSVWKEVAPHQVHNSGYLVKCSASSPDLFNVIA